MRIGTRRDLDAIARKTVDVEIPGTDTGFRIREMSLGDRDRFSAAVTMKDSKGNPEVDRMFLQAKLLVRCIIGEDGKRLFTDDEAAAFADEYGVSTVDLLFKAAQKLNGLEAAAAEAAEKNSASIPTGASPSA